ncbi:MAG: AI-2E family transporter [Candidatus Obscuribacterales bacterium]|nr:AI-2E family transporter [Candidatus Obscuribacterales bacterium]
MPDSKIEAQQASAVERRDHLSTLLRQLSIVVLALLTFFLIWQIGAYFADIIRILIYSVLLSYLFINVVDYLEKYIRNRAAAILVVYVLLTAVTIFGIIVIIPAVIYQVSQLVSNIFNNIPQAIEYLTNLLSPLEARLHQSQIQVRAIDILTNLAANMPKPDPSQILGRMSDVAMSTMTWLLYGLSIIVTSFWLLLDGHNMKENIIRLFPSKHHDLLSVMSTDMDLTLQMFFRGQIVLGLLFGAFMVAVFFFMGVHYALLLGGFLGICEIIPVIGPTIGFIPALASVAVDGMDNISTNRIAQIVIVFLVLNLVQWLKDNIVAPRYMGNVIGLHPVMIFITIMIGARIDGVSGIVCALPAACVINVLLSHMVPRFAVEHPMELPQDAQTKVVADAKTIEKVESPATATD